ncbi:MAG: hypothetical protein GQ540_07555 [Lutibacter sp.]|uniref:hypothetical protein n=1 Tax=Lutibacter sp. TaxID=1925666 RepID=UPI001A076D74|nr:hypothetical protein [Lutibacter sp.]NOR28368.1 hypothetical protein [Lutibacter sp.]
MNKIKYILSIAFIIPFLSCGGGGDDEPITPDPPVIVNPSAAVLVFPDNDEECNSGISMNTTQSKVNFNWDEAANASSYTVVVENLLTNVEFLTNSTVNQVDIIIQKSTPYKWWVISKATGTIETATSTVWKFYNSGDAIQTYAPFPAEISSPVMGATVNGTTVNLEWVGSDVDNDIKEYDVYLDNVDPPTTMIETVTLQNVSKEVSTNTYYWKVLTRDDEGNTSNSQVFQFRVE